MAAARTVISARNQACLTGGDGAFGFIDTGDGLPAAKQRERQCVAVLAVTRAGPLVDVDSTKRVGIFLLLLENSPAFLRIDGDLRAEQLGLGLGQIFVRRPLSGPRGTQRGTGLIGARQNLLSGTACFVRAAMPIRPPKQQSKKCVGRRGFGVGIGACMREYHSC